jgi:hypothetical protein
MRKTLRVFAASTLALGAVVCGPLFAQAQEKAAPARDETKMDAKGIPGSRDTQSGKAPAEALGSSGTSGSVSGSRSSPDEQPKADKDETKIDAKGVPGSQATQSGESPAPSK